MDAFCSPKAVKPPSQDAKVDVAATPALKPQNAAVTATPAVKPPAPPKTTSEKASAPEAPPAETSKTQKKKVAQGTWSSSVRRQLEKADARAAAALQSNEITTEAVERVLAGIAEWPTQARGRRRALKKRPAGRNPRPAQARAFDFWRHVFASCPWARGKLCFSGEPSFPQDCV